MPGLENRMNNVSTSGENALGMGRNGRRVWERKRENCAFPRMSGLECQAKEIQVVSLR